MFLAFLVQVIRFTTYRLRGPSKSSRPLQWPQHLDRLTISDGWGLCLGGAGNGKTTQQRELCGHQAWTEKRQQNPCSYLEVLPRQAFPYKREGNSSTPCTAQLPAPASSSLLSCSHTESSGVLRSCSYAKLGLEQGHEGHSDSLLLPHICPSHYCNRVRTVIPKLNTKGKQRDWGKFMSGIYILIA